MRALSRNTHFVFLSFVLVCMVVFLKFSGTVQPQPLLRSLEEFPLQIGEFSFVGSQEFDDSVIQVAGMDNYIMWQFQNENGDGIGLYVGYYLDQVEGGIIHSPKHCMPGSGWEPSTIEEISFTDKLGKGYTVTQMIMQKGAEKQVAHYWYHGRGRVVASEYIDRGLMVYDSIVRQRSDGALVRITGFGNDIERDVRLHRQFMKELMPILDGFLPQ